MALNTGVASALEPLIARRISLVAVCCSWVCRKERTRSEYDGEGSELPAEGASGVPH
jgi:hypothetical protein